MLEKGHKVTLRKLAAGTPLTRTTYTQLRDVKLAHAWSLHPYLLVSLPEDGKLQTKERETYCLFSESYSPS